MSLFADGRTVAFNGSWLANFKNFIYRWNGSGWSQLGAGLEAMSGALSLSSDGQILVLGKPFAAVDDYYNGRSKRFINLGLTLLTLSSAVDTVSIDIDKVYLGPSCSG